MDRNGIVYAGTEHGEVYTLGPQAIFFKTIAFGRVSFRISEKFYSIRLATLKIKQS
jgi:hypothetical protein